MTPLRALVALALGLVGSVPVTLAPAAATTSASVTVLASPTQSGVLRSGEDLVVLATVANSGNREIDAARLGLRLADRKLATAEDVRSWYSEDDATGRAVAELDDLLLPARSSRTFELRVPAAELGLPADSDSWGVRGLSTTLDAGGTVTVSRSTAVWYPDGAAESLGLALVMPLTVPRPESGLVTAEDLAVYTAPDGLLSRQLDAALGQEVTLGVDPMLIASIRVLGDAAPAEATEWLDRLDGASNDTFALGYADSDPTLALQAGQTSLPQPTSLDFALHPSVVAEDPKPSAPPSPDTRDGVPVEQLTGWEHTLGNLAWPSDGSVTKADLQSLSSAGVSAVLLASSNLAEPSRTSLVDLGGLAGLVTDPQLSPITRTASAATSEATWRAAAAELAAGLAASAGGATTPVMVTLDRGFPAAGAYLADTLRMLSQLPWVDPTGLSELLTAAPADKATLVDRAHPAGTLDRVRAMLEVEQRVAQTATVAAQPDLVTGERRASLLGLLSQSWADAPESWARSIEAYLDRSEDLQRAVQVVEPAGNVHVLADRSNLRISIQNDLPQPVTVVVNARPLNALLAVEDPQVEVTVPAASLGTAQIPVQSVSNGNVTVRVSLASPSGTPIGDTVSMRLSVQAGWETAGTAVLATAVLAVFGVGLVRTVLRRRGERAANGVGDEPDE